MPNLIREAMPGLYVDLRDNMGDAVLYRRPSESFEVTYPVTVRLRKQVKDDRFAYIAKLILADLPFDPEAGDQIIHDGSVYHIADIDQSEFGCATLGLRRIGPV